MKSLNIIIASTTLTLLIFALMPVQHQEGQQTPANASPGFDHSQCQYPDRVSNPPDGCDNSDPACGEIAKGATSCPADVLPATTPELKQPINECGGN